MSYQARPNREGRDDHIEWVVVDEHNRVLTTSMPERAAHHWARALNMAAEQEAIDLRRERLNKPLDSEAND